MNQDLLIQQPDAPAELLLLFHGVGGEPDNLLGLGRLLASARPQAMVVSVCAPQRCDFGSGWQWFAVGSIDERNRIERIAVAMPQFVERIREWQQRSGLDAAHTVLIGFSQGAILALESTQLDSPPAACVVSMAGRLAQPARQLQPGQRVHLLHGRADGVIDPQYSQQAAQQLAALGAQVSLDLFAGLGHGIHGELAQRLLQRLAGSAQD